MKHPFLISCLVTTIFTLPGRAAVLSQWEFGTGSNATSVAATTIDSGLSNTPTLGIGSGLNMTSLTTNRWGVNGFGTATNSVANDLASSISGNDFISFTLTPQAGSEIDYTSIEFFALPRANTNTFTFTLFSSIDGFTADKALVSTTISGTGQFRTLDLTSIVGLQNVTSAVTFRLYGFRSTAGANADIAVQFGRSGTDFIVNGTVSAIPEPSSSVALLGLGALGAAGWRRRSRRT